MFKGNDKNSRMTTDIILIFLLLTLDIFHTFTVSFVDFEQVNASWALFTTQDKRRNHMKGDQASTVKSVICLLHFYAGI